MLSVDAATAKARATASSRQFMQQVLPPILPEYNLQLTQTLTKLLTFTSHYNQYRSEETVEPNTGLNLVPDAQPEIRLLSEISIRLQVLLSIVSSLNIGIRAENSERKGTDACFDGMSTIETLYLHLLKVPHATRTKLSQFHHVLNLVKAQLLDACEVSNDMMASNIVNNAPLIIVIEQLLAAINLTRIKPIAQKAKPSERPVMMSVVFNLFRATTHADTKLNPLAPRRVFGDNGVAMALRNLFFHADRSHVDTILELYAFKMRFVTPTNFVTDFPMEPQMIGQGDDAITKAAKDIGCDDIEVVNASFSAPSMQLDTDTPTAAELDLMRRFLNALSTNRFSPRYSKRSVVLYTTSDADGPVEGSFEVIYFLCAALNFFEGLPEQDGWKFDNLYDAKTLSHLVQKTYHAIVKHGAMNLVAFDIAYRLMTSKAIRRVFTLLDDIEQNPDQNFEMLYAFDSELPATSTDLKTFAQQFNIKLQAILKILTYGMQRFYLERTVAGLSNTLSAVERISDAKSAIGPYTPLGPQFVQLANSLLAKVFVFQTFANALMQFYSTHRIQPKQMLIEGKQSLCPTALGDLVTLLRQVPTPALMTLYVNYHRPNVLEAIDSNQAGYRATLYTQAHGPNYYARLFVCFYQAIMIVFVKSLYKQQTFTPFGAVQRGTHLSSLKAWILITIELLEANDYHSAVLLDTINKITAGESLYGLYNFLYDGLCEQTALQIELLNTLEKSATNMQEYGQFNLLLNAMRAVVVPMGYYRTSQPLLMQYAEHATTKMRDNSWLPVYKEESNDVSEHEVALKQYILDLMDIIGKQLSAQQTLEQIILKTPIMTRFISITETPLRNVLIEQLKNYGNTLMAPLLRFLQSPFFVLFMGYCKQIISVEELPQQAIFQNFANDDRMLALAAEVAEHDKNIAKARIPRHKQRAIDDAQAVADATPESITQAMSDAAEAEAAALKQLNGVLYQPQYKREKLVPVMAKSLGELLNTTLDAANVAAGLSPA
tara:strand:+ start:66053 stop:69052 length:3000 start_codon:yes stop_codon:yes gene_type:complete